VFVVFICSWGIAQEDEFLLFGGDNNDFGVSLVENENTGGIILLASTRSFGNGSSDFLVMSLTKDLYLMNDQTYGGLHHDLPKSLVKGNNNEYVLFGSSFDFAAGDLNYNLTKVDATANFISRSIILRANLDIGNKIIKTNDGNYVFIGMSGENDSYGQTKFFKINEQGEILLEKDFGEDAVRDYGFDIVENENGFLLLSTTYCEIGLSASFGVFSYPSDVSVLQIDPEGNILWEYIYEGDDYDYAYSFVQTNDHIFVAMNTRSYEAASFDIRILKLNLQGELVDSYNFGGQGFEYAYRIIEDDNSDLLICGSTSSDVNKPSFYAFKINQNGELLWTKSIEKNASVYAYDVIERSNGNFLFTGKYAFNIDNSDIFLLELDKEGEIVSQNLFSEGDDVKVFPNPSQGNFIIYLGNNTIEEIWVYNVAGEVVYKETRNGNTLYANLSLGFLDKGIYILNILKENGERIQKKIILY
jgi:hypothetical protein